MKEQTSFYYTVSMAMDKVKRKYLWEQRKVKRYHNAVKAIKVEIETAGPIQVTRLQAELADTRELRKKAIAEFAHIKEVYLAKLQAEMEQVKAS